MDGLVHGKSIDKWMRTRGTPSFGNLFVNNWKFPMGAPKSSKSLDNFSIETHCDLGIPHFQKPPYAGYP